MQTQNLRVLSLYDGMSCGYIALMVGGYTVQQYVAFENDAYCIKTSKHNFPNIQHQGDVFSGDYTQYRGFDLLCGGSPCTHWSIAQKKNRETVASGLGWELFQQYVRALNEAQPKAFIYENNKSMSQEIRQSITQTFGFEPYEINSAVLSAQHRQRLYWVGVRQTDGSYKRADVTIPEDMGIVLADVLDTADFKALSENEMSYMTRGTNGKYSDRWTYLQKPGQKDKSVCITANISKGVPYNICATPVQVGALPRPDGTLSTSQGFRIYDIGGKSVTLKGNAGGSGGKTGLYAIPVEFSGDIPVTALLAEDQKIYPVYYVQNNQILFGDTYYPIKLADGFYIIRKLSVAECKRLQTVPDWVEFPVSNTQALKQLGNGWTVSIITLLIDAIFQND